MAAPDNEKSDDPIARFRNDERERTVAKQWHRIAGVGIEFVIAVLLAGGIGWWLDSKFGTTPWLPSWAWVSVSRPACT